MDFITPHTSPLDVADALRQRALQRAQDRWWEWPNVTAGFQLGVERCLGSVPPFPQPTGRRGIVIAGGGRYLASVYVTVRVLRHVGCTLPIEVWHFDGENDPRMQAVIAEYGVDFVNADQLAQERPFRFLPWHWWKGWQLKSFALLHTGFEEVLFLDADSYPSRDPEYLFDWPEYLERGAVIWPDVPPTTASAKACGLFQIQPPTERLAESGQLLIDRRNSWTQLILAGFYNQAADITYQYIWGDKDTFLFAWMRTGKPYGRMWPECQGRSDCLLQYDFNGHVIFQHRIGDKFRLEGINFDSSPQCGSKNRYHEDLAHESFCFYALHELRTRLMVG